MNKSIEIFKSEEFGEVRTIVDGDKILFCGSDVAKALGYSRPNDAISAHCRATVKHSTPISGKIQEINFITEGDVYRLIIRSHLPSAEKFEKWVFEEVLPSIRTHGGYLTNDKINEILSDPDTIIRLATDLKKAREEKLLLEQRVAEYEPKILYLDSILGSTNSLTVKQIAADYGLSAQQLNKILNEEHIQYKVGNQWLLYKNHMNMGYTQSRTIPIDKHGRTEVILQTRWTQKGRLKIHHLLQDRGIMANIDKEAC